MNIKENVMYKLLILQLSCRRCVRKKRRERKGKVDPVTSSISISISSVKTKEDSQLKITKFRAIIIIGWTTVVLFSHQPREFCIKCRPSSNSLTVRKPTSMNRSTFTFIISLSTALQAHYLLFSSSSFSSTEPSSLTHTNTTLLRLFVFYDLELSLCTLLLQNKAWTTYTIVCWLWPTTSIYSLYDFRFNI